LQWLFCQNELRHVAQFVMDVWNLWEHLKSCIIGTVGLWSLGNLFAPNVCINGIASSWRELHRQANMKHILFIDVRNAMRSPIAAAWFNHLAKDWAQAQSCGTMPAPHISLLTVQVMAEVGIDLSNHSTQPVSQTLLNQSDIIVLMGRDIYPSAFAPTLVWDFEDMNSESLERVREVRDRIFRQVEAFVKHLRRAHHEEIAWQVQIQQQLLNEYLIPI
jgi:protein-tyrosine-phosphatase